MADDKQFPAPDESRTGGNPLDQAAGATAYMESAAEGGAWGIALLAAYMQWKDKGETLDSFLAKKVFASAKQDRVEPDAKGRAGFLKFMETYAKGVEIEKAAIKQLR